MLSDFYKDDPTDTIWQVDDIESIGSVLFSFDRKKIYNAFSDYPYNMTDEECRIFEKEMPYWADFFKWRKE